MTDLQARKEAEQRQQAVGAELADLSGRRAQRLEPLPGFGGVCVLHFVRDRIERVVFTLHAGEYTLELYDFTAASGETKRVSVAQDGEPFNLPLAGRVPNPQNTELMVRKKGSAEEYRFTLAK